jgi:hypothetical protein
MRVALTTLLLLVTTLVSAGSVKVTEVGDTVYYVEPESIARNDITYELIYRVSVVHDYARPEPSGVRSRRVWYEINCSAERLRSVSATEYSQPLAQGNSVNSWQRESDWLYIEPITGTNIPARTPYRSLVKHVCSR